MHSALAVLCFGLHLAVVAFDCVCDRCTIKLNGQLVQFNNYSSVTLEMHCIIFLVAL